MKRDVLAALREHFRPEFLNRVDEIVVFHSLSREQLKRIVEIPARSCPRAPQRAQDRARAHRRAEEHFANAGYDPVYGARPLKRLLQKEIETNLGRKILTGEVPDGSRVTVDFDGHALVFRITPPPTA